MRMLIPIAGQMWDGDHHMGRGWWWVMGIGWLVFLGLIAVVVVLLVRRGTGSGRSAGAEDVLAERYARGEIDDDEYRRRLDVLRGK
jgi:putative membrane protein